MPAAALNIPSMRAAFHALQALESLLAAVDGAGGPALDFLSVVARVFHVLMTELAPHDGLLLFQV
jgi:hypothetical protein